MKQVIAFIRPQKLGAVVHALHQVPGLLGLSAGDVRGLGRRRVREGRETIEEQLELLRPQVRIEVACSDAIVDRVVEAIADTARTGLAGDGKVYVAELRDAVRIATGERGEGAV